MTKLKKAWVVEIVSVNGFGEECDLLVRQPFYHEPSEHEIERLTIDSYKDHPNYSRKINVKSFFIFDGPFESPVVR